MLLMNYSAVSAEYWQCSIHDLCLFVTMAGFS